MTGEWIRFGIVAFFLILSLVCFTAEVIGVYRFGFVMNRMHAAGIGDSLGLFSVLFAMTVASGLELQSLKFLLIAVFMWFSSPASTHFLGQVEYFTNPSLYLWAERIPDPGENEAEKAEEEDR